MAIEDQKIREAHRHMLAQLGVIAGLFIFGLLLQYGMLPDQNNSMRARVANTDSVQFPMPGDLLSSRAELTLESGEVPDSQCAGQIRAAFLTYMERAALGISSLEPSKTVSVAASQNFIATDLKTNAEIICAKQRTTAGNVITVGWINTKTDQTYSRNYQPEFVPWRPSGKAKHPDLGPTLTPTPTRAPSTPIWTIDLGLPFIPTATPAR